MQWKVNIAVIILKVNIAVIILKVNIAVIILTLLQAWQSCHVQNFVTIPWFEFG